MMENWWIFGKQLESFGGKLKGSIMKELSDWFKKIELLQKKSDEQYASYGMTLKTSSDLIIEANKGYLNILLAGLPIRKSVTADELDLIALSSMKAAREMRQENYFCERCNDLVYDFEKFCEHCQVDMNYKKTNI